MEGGKNERRKEQGPSLSSWVESDSCLFAVVQDHTYFLRSPTPCPSNHQEIQASWRTYWIINENEYELFMGLFLSFRNCDSNNCLL